MRVVCRRMPPSLFAVFFFLGLLLLIAAPDELSAQASLPKLIRIRFPRGNAREVLLPVHVLIKLDAQANPATLRVTLNGKNISERFKPTTGNQWQAQLNRNLLNVGQNSLRAVVSDKTTGARQTRRRNFYLDASARQNPDAANHARRRAARGLDDADVTFTPFNANLYSGSQTNTRQNFGHGMYIVKGWASLEPVISSWFLDAIQPDATNFPGLSPLWRWSELDWEFVPYTVSPQREQMLVSSAFPNPAVTIQRSDPTSCTPVNGQYDDNTLTQEIASLWNAGGQTRTAGDPTLVTPNTPITPTDFVDFAHNIALIPQSPSPYGFSLNPNYGTSGPQYWWSQTAPSFVSTWPLPCSILPVPPSNEMANSVAVNVFRMPHGSLVTTGGVTNTITSTVIPDIDQSQLPTSQPKPGNLTNESFALIQNGVDLYSGWNTYTILVTPSFIAFYINAGSEGTDIENATPVRKLDINDPTNPYPSIDAFGPNMIGSQLPFEDYNNVPQPMGNLRFMLQNWVDGQGWSGPQPPENFQGAEAYVQALQFYPLDSGNGSQNADYSASPTFDLDTTQWTSANAQYNLMKNFHTLYGGNPMITDTQTTSPQLVQWTNAPDNSKALALGLVPIGDLPANANFFVLAPGGTQGKPSTYTAAQIDVPNQAYSNAAFPQTDAFWGPVGVPITVTVWYVENPSKTCSGQIQLNNNLTWSVVSVANGCAPILPAPPFTSGNNTIGLGTGF